MKTYTILARAINNPKQIRRMAEIRCKNASEARQWAMANVWQKLGNEQMIVASPEQLKRWEV